MVHVSRTLFGWFLLSLSLSLSLNTRKFVLVSRVNVINKPCSWDSNQPTTAIPPVSYSGATLAIELRVITSAGSKSFKQLMHVCTFFICPSAGHRKRIIYHVYRIIDFSKCHKRCEPYCHRFPTGSILGRQYSCLLTVKSIRGSVLLVCLFVCFTLLGDVIRQKCPATYLFLNAQFSSIQTPCLLSYTFLREFFQCFS